MKKLRKLIPYFMIAPAGFLMLALVIYPILFTFVYSLKQFKLNRPNDTKFIGLKNYINIFRDADFYYSLQNSIIILIVSTILTIVIAMLFSLLLHKKTKLNTILMAIAIVPWALPPIVNGFMWRWIFHSSFGLVNRLLLKLNLIDIPIQWLSNRYSIMIITGIALAFRTIPFAIIIFVSAMISIPKEIYEASKIDGAGKFNIFKKITLPLLLPAIIIVLTSTSITAFNVFDEIVSLVGYEDFSKTLILKSYIHTFVFLDFGYGSAVTYITMLIGIVFGIFYVRNAYREVNYL